MTRPPRILLFDSGRGGLTVARAVAGRLPQAHLFYCADNGGFPYGAWEEATLIERILTVLGRAIALCLPDVVVVACNTASTIAMEQLREMFPVPFVGTVPAIKPAAEQTRSGIIGVLATPATVKREYTQALIDNFAAHAQVQAAKQFINAPRQSKLWAGNTRRKPKIVIMTGPVPTLSSPSQRPQGGLPGPKSHVSRWS